MADGLVSADLEPHPAMAEVAWVHRPVTVTKGRGGKLRITNRRSFTDTSDLTGTWEVVEPATSTSTAGRLRVRKIKPGRDAAGSDAGSDQHSGMAHHPLA